MMNENKNVKFIKPSLIAACNEVSGQSAACETEDIALSNDTVERRISDMAEGGYLIWQKADI
jgi:hypothetical protein